MSDKVPRTSSVSVTDGWLGDTHGNRAPADGDEVSLMEDSRGRLRGTPDPNEKYGAKEVKGRLRMRELRDARGKYVGTLKDVVLDE